MENVPGLKLKAPEDFANGSNCAICKQPFNAQRNVNKHHWYEAPGSRLCANSICGECSRKRINAERVCDMCFLKQALRRQEHERKEQFRLREQAIEKMTHEIAAFTSEIEHLDREIVEVDRRTVDMESAHHAQLTARQDKLAQRLADVKKLEDRLAAKKKALLLKREELETREERNKLYASKVQLVKLDISSKQTALLEKMEQLDRLRAELDKLEKYKQELLKEFK